MSFSSQVKYGLASMLPANECCRAAQAYGMLECGHVFSCTEISIKTENEAVAGLYAALVTTVCGLKPEGCTVTIRPGGLHSATVNSRLCSRVLERFGHTSADVFSRLNRSNLECDDCDAAYLRGAFLSCGSVSDPSIGYHMELNLSFYHLSRDLLALMHEAGLKPRLVRRKSSNILYIKESEQIEDFLTMIGAVDASLEIMNVKILRNIRNTANRVTNCENANIDKTVAAAVEQVSAIQRLKERGKFSSLPDELCILAELRLENPDMSLRELGQQLDPPLSRSGVNHRLMKLIGLAQE